ncbi:MAG: hypothetical protein J5I87_05475 [Nitrosomonas nitrosa]|nr:hypothetical protein [Nitrosomonas nitrosa]MCO6433725.1 hypothetical protein [Nitrosomonas nitrosa]
MEITCYRDPEFRREERFLPAITYNIACQLLARSSEGYLFVPIRSMQYLAILGQEEFVFIDGERKCWIDIAWQNFRPQERMQLSEPVGYEVVYYREDQSEIMQRIQKEFPKALQQLSGKQIPKTPAQVIKFPSLSNFQQ